MASQKSPWLFDVTSLMVLLGENEESVFRSARESYLEALVAAPVAGIQSYLKIYDGVPGTSRPTYLSPYGCKSAPLRNLRLENAIRHLRLLENGKYNTYEIDASRGVGKLYWIRLFWLMFSWLCFGCLIVFWYYAPFGVLPQRTWVGITTMAVLTFWSIIVRIIELGMVVRSEKDRETKRQQKSKHHGDDAAIFMGENNSAFVIQGQRKDVKDWTTVNRLDFNNGTTYGFQNKFFQYFIRIGTVLVLLFVLVTVPNGSTTDQLVFIVLNILGQANVFLGLHINAKCCLRELKGSTHTTDGSIMTENRTQIYGNLHRHFKDLGDSEWGRKTGTLPNTTIWNHWATLVVNDLQINPTDLYEGLKNGSIPIPTAPPAPQAPVGVPTV